MKPPVKTLAGAALALMLLLGGCGGGGDPDPAGNEAALGKSGPPAPSADILLVGSSTGVSLTSDDTWSLNKDGSLSGNTVTWNITAAKTATTSGHLVIQGQMTVTNTGTGTGPATIGNIVVNLQARQGNTWATKSSDIANATEGDAATTAKIHAAASSESKSSFSESSASGALEFMDATNNTLFSLVPQVLIGAGQTRSLLFSASFNNNDVALKLLPGTQIRAEVIVTFGNATQSGNATSNVDINGNGVIDADENRVRSVPSRLTLTVPAAVNGNDRFRRNFVDIMAAARREMIDHGHRFDDPKHRHFRVARGAGQSVRAGRRRGRHGLEPQQAGRLHPFAAADGGVPGCDGRSCGHPEGGAARLWAEQGSPHFGR